MKINVFIASVFIVIIFGCNSSTKTISADMSLAQTPPMGWNSFDSYGVYLHEEAALANMEAFAEKLLPHGYEYFVIDAGWFGEFDLQPGTIYPAEKHAIKNEFQ
jgi:alpha-galactosidase